MIKRIVFLCLTCFIAAQAYAQGAQGTDSDSSTAADSTALGPSEPIFDWSKYQGQTEVPHPFAKKGLIRITKDGVYVYKEKTTTGDRAASLKVGMYDPANLSNPNEAGQPNSTFSENYTANNPAILFDYEWQLWRTPIGKLGLKAGTGFYVAQGHGHFEDTNVSNNPQVTTPQEVFTFIALPNSFGGIYRAQFWPEQLIVPYGEGGLTAFTFTELRNDTRGPKFGGALATYFAAGGAFNLTYFDQLAKVQLNREYGVSDVYLTVEYRDYIAITRYNFSGGFVDAGFLMEF